MNDGTFQCTHRRSRRAYASRRWQRHEQGCTAFETLCAGLSEVTLDCNKLTTSLMYDRSWTLKLVVTVWKPVRWFECAPESSERMELCSICLPRLNATATKMRLIRRPVDVWRPCSVGRCLRSAVSRYSLRSMQHSIRTSSKTCKLGKSAAQSTASVPREARALPKHANM